MMKFQFIVLFSLFVSLCGMEENACNISMQENEKRSFRNQLLLKSIMPTLNPYLDYNTTYKLSRTSKMMREAILYPAYIQERQELSKKILCEDPANTSRVVCTKLGAIGYMRKICSKCLHPSCRCKRQSTEDRYGMLVRRQRRSDGGIDEYRAYTPSFAVKKLFNKINKFKNKSVYITVKCDVHFPYDDPSFIIKDYADRSDPYVNEHGDISVLCYTAKKCSGRDQLAGAHIYELALSGDDAYFCRPVYFSFNNAPDNEYPLNDLRMMPLLLEKYIQEIAAGVYRGAYSELNKVVFNFPLHNPAPKFVSDEIFSYACTALLENRQKDFDIPAMALCLKYMDNWELAKNYLSLYDPLGAPECVINNYRTIKTDFFCGTFHNFHPSEFRCCAWNFPSWMAEYQYQSKARILRSLMTPHSIEDLKRIYLHNQSQIFKGNNHCFMELHKMNNNYTIFPWREIFYDRHWIQSEKAFYLINCKGIITNITIVGEGAEKYNAVAEKVDDITRLQITEKQESGEVYTHIIHADTRDMPSDICTLAKSYFEVSSDKEAGWLCEQSTSNIIALLHIAGLQKRIIDYLTIKRSLCKRYCPSISDDIYDDFDVSKSDKIDEDGDCCIHRQLEKIIDAKLPHLTFDQKEYAPEELQKPFLAISEPETCLQFVHYLDKAVQYYRDLS